MSPNLSTLPLRHIPTDRRTVLVTQTLSCHSCGAVAVAIQIFYTVL